MKQFKINRDKKTFVFDDGREIPIPEQDVKDVLRSASGRKLKEKEKEGYKKTYGGSIGAFSASMDEAIFGNPAETLVNYLKAGGKGLFKGEGQEELGFVDRVLDNFYSLQEGRKEALSELQNEYPTATKFGKGAGTIGELALTAGIPAKYALPIMGMGHSETSFLEPGQKAQEVGKDAAVGLILDKFFKGLGNVASQRGARRAAKEGIAKAEAANAAELSRVEGMNAAEKARFAQETAAREAQLAQIPGLQSAENQNFFLSSLQNLGRALKNIGKQSVSSEVAGVEEFITNSINTTGRAASKEGNFASKFLRSIFKGDKEGKLTSDTIKKGMRALDEGISNHAGMTREILTDYKNYLLQRLPESLSQGYVYSKWTPKILGRTVQNLEGQLSKVISAAPSVSQEISQKFGSNFTKKLIDNLEKSLQKVVEKYQGNLIQSLESGAIEKEVIEAVKNNSDFQKLFNSVTNFQFLGKGKGAEFLKGIDPKNLSRAIPGLGEVQQVVSTFPEMVGQRFAQATSELVPQIAKEAEGISQSALKNLRNVPSQPTFIPEPAQVPPVSLQQPNLQPIPSLPAPEGSLGKLAHWLEKTKEKPLLSTAKGLKGAGMAGILSSLVGLPTKTIGGAALGAYGAGRALTSPSKMGDVLRSALQTGSRIAFEIEEMASKYPSYKDGILENPEERRSLTREIEDNPNLSLSEKAIYQSKINRGKPLNSKLQ